MYRSSGLESNWPEFRTGRSSCKISWVVDLDGERDGYESNVLDKTWLRVGLVDGDAVGDLCNLIEGARVVLAVLVSAGVVVALPPSSAHPAFVSRGSGADCSSEDSESESSSSNKKSSANK